MAHTRGIAIIVLALAGGVSNAAGSYAAVDKRVAPGVLISVGDRRLHLNCVGHGSPTVVFDSGLGGSSLDWVLVQSEVAAFSRACSYDRAGYGWSDAGPLPRDSASISRDLETLLGNARVPPPYVLVGHSFGGYNVRLFSHDNPHLIAGLVLIDASHEDQFERFDAAGVRSSAPRRDTFIVRRVTQVPAALPREYVPVARSFAARRSSMVTVRSELLHLRDSARQLQNASAFPDVPVVVISHRVNGTAASPATEKRARIWMDLQSDLARRAVQGTHLIAATDNHYVHLAQPRIVIDSIRDVIRRSH